QVTPNPSLCRQIEDAAALRQPDALVLLRRHLDTERRQQLACRLKVERLGVDQRAVVVPENRSEHMAYVLSLIVRECSVLTRSCTRAPRGRRDPRIPTPNVAAPLVGAAIDGPVRATRARATLGPGTGPRGRRDPRIPTPNVAAPLVGAAIDGPRSGHKGPGYTRTGNRPSWAIQPRSTDRDFECSRAPRGRRDRRIPFGPRGPGQHSER